MKEYKVDAKGSLGILALGDIGIRLWREAREKEEAEEKKHTENKQSENHEKKA